MFGRACERGSGREGQGVCGRVGGFRYMSSIGTCVCAFMRAWVHTSVRI